MSYFNYTDLVRSLRDPSLVDPGSTLIYVGAYDPYISNILYLANLFTIYCQYKLIN